MDIRNWPLDRIMQLPDWCFGRRWLISSHASVAADVTGFALSSGVFPEKGVIWEFVTNTHRIVNSPDYIRLGFADQLPANAAEFNQLTPILPDLGDTNYSPPRFIFYGVYTVPLTRLRLCFTSVSRRMAMQLTAVSTGPAIITASLVISSIPTEVPDWLCSGRV